MSSEHSEDFRPSKKSDNEATLADLKEEVRLFGQERNWGVYHTPKNLAGSIMIEAAELLEHFQWLTPEESEAVAENPTEKREIGEEMADVLSYLLGLANRLDIDLADAFFEKMKKNRAKYPKERFYGVYGYRDPKLDRSLNESGENGEKAH